VNVGQYLRIQTFGIDGIARERGIKMIEEEIIYTMLGYGGGFIKNLAKLYISADTSNKQRLERCFKDYFDEYRSFHARLMEKRMQENESNL